MSRSRGVALLLVALGVALVPAACGAGESACLRLSDCEAPYQCVEGTCRSDETLGIQPGSSEAGASEASGR